MKDPSTTQPNDAPIFLLASTGLIIRNLLLGHFGRLISARRPLVVAVPSPRDPRLVKVAAEIGHVTLVKFPFRQDLHKLNRFQRLFRWETYMPRFIAGTKTTRSAGYLKRFRDSDHTLLGGLFTGSVWALGRLAQRTGLLPFFERRYLASMQNEQIVARWRELFDEHRPAAVISTALSLASLDNHSQDLPAVVAADVAGIPRGTLIQSWDNLSGKSGVIPSTLDRYWTWSDAMSEELLEIYPQLPAERVAKVGSCQFDFHLDPDIVQPREEFCSWFGFDPAKPVILIGTGTEVRMPFEHLTVLDLVERLHRRRPDLQCLVRLHPKDFSTRWEDVRSALEAAGGRLQSTRTEVHMDHGGFVLPRDFFRDQVTVLSHVAVVVNAASTLTVDAAVLDRPSVCIAYGLEDEDPQFPEGRALAWTRSTHYSRLVATGGVVLAHGPEECCQLIIDRVDDPSLERAGRREIVRNVIDKAGGGAGERLANEVLALAQAGGQSGGS